MELISYIPKKNLEKVLVRSIENSYKKALKKTEVLEGKIPFYSDIPLINHIGGYHDLARKFGEATSIAIKTKEGIQNTLHNLYRLKEDQLELLTQEEIKYQDLEKEYEGEKSVEVTTDFKARNSSLMGREDDITDKGNKLIALKNSVKLLDLGIMTYRRLFAKFSKRAEVAKENAKVISKV